MFISRLFTLFTALLLGLAVVGLQSGCMLPEDDDDAADDDDATGDDDDDDDNDDDDDDDGDPCENPEALRADALDNGEQLLDGVTLTESTPIADINADLAGYHEQTLQVEGMVVETCTNAGCWAMVTDPDGETLRFKVDDGALDWRDHVEIGLYVVADGVFDQFGAHGPQLFVQDHGAMVGTINCY